MKKNLQYLTPTNIQEVSSVSDDDRVMVALDSGQYGKTTKKALVASIEKAWDTTVTEAAGFHIGHVRYWQEDENYFYFAPTINDTNQAAVSVTSVVGNDDDGTSSPFVVKGQLPSTGKYWFEVTMNVADTEDWNEIGISISAYQPYDPRYVGSTYDDQAWFAVFGYSWFEYGRPGGGANSLSDDLAVPGVFNVLVCMDIDTGVVDVYDSTGIKHSATVPAVNGVPGLAGKLINGYIENWHPATEQLVFNVSNAAATPYPVPLGYSPLVMRNVTIPANSIGDILSASANGHHDVSLIRADNRYLLTSTSQLIEMVNYNQLAKTQKKNTFTKPQTFDDVVTLSNQWRFKIRYGMLNFGPENAPLEARMLSGAHAGGFIIGPAFGSARNVNSTYGIGDMGWNVETATSSLLVGYGAGGLWSVNSSVILGMSVATGLARADSTVILGPSTAASTGYFLNSSVYIGQGAGSYHNNDTAWVVPYLSASPTHIYGNVAIGMNAMSFGSYTVNNTAIGSAAMQQPNASNYTGGENTALGSEAFYGRTGNGLRNTAAGFRALSNHKGGDRNTALGDQAGFGTLGSDNVFIGSRAANGSTGTFTDVIAIGRQTLPAAASLSNVVAIGANATVTGDNQVQLGDSSTTTYVYGTVQSRSDARDKADVRETVLGLEFIRKLRPVDYRWDMRDDYVDLTTMPDAPAELRPHPVEPSPTVENPINAADWQAYLDDVEAWKGEEEQHQIAQENYRLKLLTWQSKNGFDRLRPDGRFKRHRYHHGFLAQEVKLVVDDMGVDFGGYQDHSLSDGKDVRSLGYEEFIAPLVRSVQELDQQVLSEPYINAIVQKVTTAVQTPEFIEAIANAILAKLQK